MGLNWNDIKHKSREMAAGFFIMGYVIGTGSVTSMIVSGARYNLSLLWALLLSCIFTGVLLVAVAHLTHTSGKTILHLIREKIHPVISLFLFIVLMVSVLSSIMGVAGIITSLFADWLTNMFQLTLPLGLVALFLLGFLYALFITGKQRTFFQVLSFLVALMSLSFLISTYLVVDSFADLITWAKPEIPGEGDPQFVIAGMVGTTMAAVVIVSRSYLAETQPAYYPKKERNNITQTMLATFFVSACIMATATGTLYVNDRFVNNPIEMMYVLEPLAGQWGMSLFVWGTLSAGLSSIFPNMLMVPWLLKDYSRGRLSIQTSKQRIILGGAVVLLGLAVPVLGGKPVMVMIASQALSPLSMPVLVLCILYLLNNKQIIDQKLGWVMNLALGLVLIFAIFMSFQAYSGFLNLF